jgi:hypothetical protein
MTLILERAIKEKIEEAAAGLISVRPDGDRARISLPLLYPSGSGSGSAVEVMVNGDNCFVSDFGFGALEAEIYGAEPFYENSAKKAADRFGVGFDGMSIFKTWASLSRLDAAVVAVANASVQAATGAIVRASEEKERRDNAALYERVREFFGDHAVAKHEELGGREAKWEAQNAVTLSNRRKAVFELVNAHLNSISSKYIVFADLSNLLSQLRSEEHNRHGKQRRDAGRCVQFGRVELAQGNLSSVRRGGVSRRSSWDRLRWLSPDP